MINAKEIMTNANKYLMKGKTGMIVGGLIIC